MAKTRLPLAISFLAIIPLQAQEKIESARSSVQTVLVEKDTRLEVLDWGGTGRSLLVGHLKTVDLGERIGDHALTEIR
jgi:hypothetical protein